MENKTGAFIAQLRKEHNLTQKELAEKINVTDKAISRWETGKGFPEVSLLLPLADTLNISVNELLTGEKVEKEKIIDNSNKVIVETIKKSNREFNILSIVIFVIFFIVQLAIYYGVPLTAGPGDDMGVIFFAVIATFINSISMGFIKNKLKFLVPVLTAILFVPTGFIEFKNVAPFDGEELALYTFVFLVLSLSGMLLGMFIKFIIDLMKKHIDKKRNNRIS